MPQSATRDTIAYSVLSRYLPTLSHIITTASFCHIYRGAFDTSAAGGGTFSWEKKEISGSLFLAATSNPITGCEDYHLIILNRQSVNNFIWTLSSTESIEDDGEHLVLSHTSGFTPTPKAELQPGYDIDAFSCWGIWVFPNPSVGDERSRMLEAVMLCAKRAEENKKRPQPPQAQPQAPPPPAAAQAPPAPPLNTAPSALGGYSIMDQIFPQSQAQGVISAPSPSQYAPPVPVGLAGQQTFSPPYPTPQVMHQEMPVDNTGNHQGGNGGGGNGAGGDILGRLFENARQRGPVGGC
ncbi:hypothetical protein BZA05DRAFT_247697 [Tricharina praecox]|uniref:uncharacterized protein n=1 Tax=Tricharina praecox TaxID=43433 RepID=UPI00221E4697|nr:uncharacterized protein BZA05DRAFT_247697 [Tricharina praecox]KAI5854692.1 hypothetical protein BZA05DRAFT_247697 [Tricharina praecox]